MPCAVLIIIETEILQNIARKTIPDNMGVGRASGPVELLLATRPSAVECAMRIKKQQDSTKLNVLPAHWLEPPFVFNVIMKSSYPGQ